jgi:FkbM family methyltransferase
MEIKKILKQKIEKNNYSFFVSDYFSKMWFKNNMINIWEQDTFNILEYYKNNKEGVYIDVGAWIGPTVLYSANIYKKVIAIEPDPVALSRLKENLSVNSFNNIVVIEKGLSSTDGKSEFGGNGPLGNSESTLLISNKDDYLSYVGRHTSHNHKDIVTIETITIESLIEQQDINPDHISLIKMDIEGGEKIVVPSLVNFLKKHKPVFYISLHRCFLRPSEIEEIIDILFGVYDKCYVFSTDGQRNIIDKNYIQEKNLECLVFE